jgi:hypothetical protein
MSTKETKKRIIQAGHKAVEELIKVAKEAIVESDDDLAADRLKNAAATKKICFLINQLKRKKKRGVGLLKKDLNNV